MTILTHELTRAELLAALVGATALVTSTEQALAAPPKPLPLPGVNLAGAAWGKIEDLRPIGQSHVYPADVAFAYWAGIGMKVVRLSFSIERLQPTVGGAFNTAEIREIDRCVATAGKTGLTIILDLHNYGQRAHQKMEEADLSGFFTALATRYKAQSQVAYGVMNEPYVFSPSEWQPLARGAVKAIRAVTPSALILVSGGGWDGAHDFVTSGNAAAFEGFTDSNCLIEVHQYLDHNSSGQNVQEYVAGSGGRVLQDVTAWARAKRRRLFLGEFGFAMPAGETETTALLKFMSNNSDVWAGYAIWAAGPWWGDYAFAIEPKNGQDAPQVAVLKRFM